ncbi:uncharacterized protein At5g50100, chloroplastic isoform X1 [Humulus lupulus]|uniref:uncharacterized protein At5g50100, chloroplastic isoform X1 n=1 Tax=Humulus lupulus TaxID=3486 RepID=UPI002B40C134|nr:uncharacterized protein At5g50100, chloroplastic isoform X1 [Humulus lupulus]
MALRGVAAISALAKRTQYNPSLLSISHSLTPKTHLHPLKLTPISVFQPGPNWGIWAGSEVASNPLSSKKEDEESSSPENWRIKMLYDGDCPLCMREVNMLRERNKSYGTIKFVDICSEDYSPEENQGLDFETAMGKIHAILSDGTVVTDVEAFRKLYEEVGLGWVYAITKYEPIGKIADAVYGVWAIYRLPITGRPPLEQIMEARRKNKGEVCKDNNSCKM